MKRIVILSVVAILAAILTLGCSASNPLEPPTPTATQVPTATAAAAPVTPPPTGQVPQGTSSTPVTAGGSFNPNLFDAQSCDPEQNPNGCSWDIGTIGSRVDILGRNVTQVGILKGVAISWPKGNLIANSSSNGRCALVVLAPNGWFENLNIKDGRMEIYDVDPRDLAGWTKTLAVQGAFEQQADYKCPAKRFPEDIPQWTSQIQSPPSGTPGFTGAGPQSQPSVQPSQPQAGSGSTDTIDGKERKATRDFGGSLSFSAGDAVAGFRITIAGRNYQNCAFRSAPSDGTVVDGVVHPWAPEVANLRACQ